MLIDRARIYVCGGSGGNGSASFRREKYQPKGGPDGGDGGRGGEVRLIVRPNINSLLQFQYNQKFSAIGGGNGGASNMHGPNGKPEEISVPPGTVVYDDATGDVIADLVDVDDEVVVARGGKGGLGNWHFKTSVHQAPRIAELGEPGEERWVRLELRLIADVGLVGLPNAGKSTLLAAASAARPKIADYPFTTLEPNLGVVALGGHFGQTFVMADVPGLIEGAAGGAGLGHEFLRHITRTKALIHVLDASGGLEGRDPIADFRTINDELREFDPSLLERPMLVALNKVDIPEARENLPTLRATLEAEGYRLFDISAATGEGVPPLMQAIGEILREGVPKRLPKPESKRTQRKVYTLQGVDENAWSVSQIEDGVFGVTGVGIERTTRMTNFDLEDSVTRFQRVLDATGISAELGKLGILDGDVVRIAGMDLHWGEQDIYSAAFQHRTKRNRRRNALDLEVIQIEEE